MDIKERFYTNLDMIREDYEQKYKEVADLAQKFADKDKKNRNKNRTNQKWYKLWSTVAKSSRKRAVTGMDEQAEQLDELHGKSKEAAEKIKARIEKKHDEKWEETHEKRAKEKLKGSEKTKDIDKERNNLAKRWLRADRYSKK